MLCSAKCIQGRRLTCFIACKDDVENAGLAALHHVEIIYGGLVCVRVMSLSRSKCCSRGASMPKIKVSVSIFVLVLKQWNEGRLEEKVLFTVLVYITAKLADISVICVCVVIAITMFTELVGASNRVLLYARLWWDVSRQCRQYPSFCLSSVLIFRVRLKFSCTPSDDTLALIGI